MADVKCFGHFPAIGISNHSAVYAYSSNYVDQMMDIFYTKMRKLLDDICPLKTIVSRNQPVPWMNKNIREHMDRRKIFHDWWKLNRKHQSSDILYATYHDLDEKIKDLIDENRSGDFITKYKEAKTSQERWNLIHKFGVTRKSRKQTEINIDEKFGLDKLNKQFTSLEPLPKRELNIAKVDSNFNFGAINGKSVYKTIRSITSNSTGPDELPPKLFKIVAKVISDPISHLINCSFESGIYRG